jgi:hypothetical protein
MSSVSPASASMFSCLGLGKAAALIARACVQKVSPLETALTSNLESFAVAKANYKLRY